MNPEQFPGQPENPEEEPSKIQPETVAPHEKLFIHAPRLRYLPKALELLTKGGRLCVISFHSLEDRIIKRAFLEYQNENMGKIITQKTIISGEKELEENPRARSAKLRIFEKN